jgi:hypothetical protein
LCNPFGIAVDYLRDEIVVANTNFGGGQCAQSVTTYARTADGDTPPIRTIAGPLSTLNFPTSTALFYPSTVQIADKPTSSNVSSGTAVTYNITVTAQGGKVLGVNLFDNLPSGLTWTVGGTDKSACSVVGSGLLNCSFGDLVKGQSKSINISAPTDKTNCPGISNLVTATFNDGTGLVTSAPDITKIIIKCPK